MSTRSQKPIYQEAFASVYDAMGADSFSRRMAAYCVEELFPRFQINPVSGLDLCCGTGTAIELFADHGIPMAGLDQSSAMLAMAARKLAGRKITLYRKDLPKFRLTGADGRSVRCFDLVTSFYDSLNYQITRRDLLAAFRSVRHHLNPDGWFIFDLNTEAAYQAIWVEGVNAGQRESFAWIWTTNYNATKKLAHCETTFFLKKGVHWRRVSETHFERAYSIAELRELLGMAGFQLKGLFRCLTLDKAKPGDFRVCIVAKNPG